MPRTIHCAPQELRAHAGTGATGNRSSGVAAEELPSGHVTRRLSRGGGSPDQGVTWLGPLGERRPAGHGRLHAQVFAAAGGSVRRAGDGPVAMAPVHSNLRAALHHLPAQLPIPVPRQFGRAGGLLRPRRGLPTLP